jgi:hypothetical protein
LTYPRNWTDAIGYKQKFQEFMQRLSRGKCVILIISDQYLKSENCMYELVEIAKHGEFYDRIFPIILPDAKIYKFTERMEYIRYWQDEINKLREAIKGVDITISGLTQKFPKSLIYGTAKTPRTPRFRRVCVSPIYLKSL